MNKHRSILVALAIFALLALVLTTGGAQAQSGPTEATIPYSSRLNDETGQPVANGQYDFKFMLYAAEKGGTLLWSETQTDVTVRGGVLNVTLGATVTLPKEVRERKELWLAVSVRGPQEADFTLLEPRQNVGQGNSPTAVTALTCPHSHFTDYWHGATVLGYGLSVENAGTGDGIRGYSQSTLENFAGVYGLNTATTGTGSGVYGESINGTGVFGYSNMGLGLYGKSDANDGIRGGTQAGNKSGVLGVNTVTTTIGYGVYGIAPNGFGLGAAGNDTSTFDQLGDLLLVGNLGEIFAPGLRLGLYSNGDVGIDLDDDNNSQTPAVFEILNGNNAAVFHVNENGDMAATGTKSAQVKTADHGERLLYAVESPGVWFEDFGSAQLSNGAATVGIEPIFAETVNLKEDYHVFVTPLGDCALYVSEKTPTSFAVKALAGQTCNVAFDYRIVAKRLGYEGTRLAPPDPTPISRSQEDQ